MLDSKLLCSALDLVDVGLAIVGVDHRVRWCSAAYASLVDRPVEELIGTDFFGEARPCDQVQGLQQDWELGEMAMVSGEGATGPVDVTIRPLSPDYPDLLVVLRRGLVRPVEAQRLPPEVVDELSAYVAELTGHAPEPATLASGPLSILMLGIAELELVRMSHGEEAAEEILRQVAQVLVLQKRKADVIARYRGGQFLVLAPRTTRYSATMLAERIRRHLAVLDLDVRGHRLSITLLSYATDYRPALDGPIRGAVEKASAALAAQALQVVS